VRYVEDFVAEGLMPGDCASCTRGPEKCLLKTSSVDLKAQGMPPLGGVTAANAEERLGAANFLGRCFIYGLCPIPLIPLEVAHMYELVNMLGGTSRLSTPEDFYRLPAKYIEAVKIVNAERAAIAAEKRDNGNRH
jgi:hypothetical protein